MSKKPIMEFENIEQAYECLAEWQTRLFLNDWLIKICLCDEEVHFEGEKQAGIIDFKQSIKTARIDLSPHNEENNSGVLKFCHEKVLVHELMHLKINFACVPSTCEEAYFASAEHALIEQMAKSLVMAKYGLDFSWFKNF